MKNIYCAFLYGAFLCNVASEQQAWVWNALKKTMQNTAQSTADVLGTGAYAAKKGFNAAAGLVRGATAVGKTIAKTAWNYKKPLLAAAAVGAAAYVGVHGVHFDGIAPTIQTANEWWNTPSEMNIASLANNTMQEAGRFLQNNISSIATGLAGSFITSQYIRDNAKKHDAQQPNKDQ